MKGQKKRSPTLIVTKQDSLANQKVAKNGVHRNVHVVVKNTPFNIGLAVVNNAPATCGDHIDLHCCSVEAVVKYDGDNPEEGKLVELMNNKPCEYKFAVSEKKSDEGTLEVRMKVLTSQHEDMLFRLHMSILDSNKEVLLSAYSEAIKVVSKPDQVRRIKGVKGKKKTQNDVVGETLGRIEKRQKQQHALLQRLLKDAGEDTAGLSLSLSSSAGMSLSSGMDVKPDPASSSAAAEPMDFEKAFTVCLKRFAEMPSDERPSKIRRLVSASTARDTRNISEFVDLLGVEGLRRRAGAGQAMVVDSVGLAAARDAAQSQQQQQPQHAGENLPISVSSALSASYGVGYFGDLYQDIMETSLLPEFM